jgi:predicted permease
MPTPRPPFPAGVRRLLRLDLRRPGAAPDDVAAELRFHLEERVAQLVAHGWSPDDAEAEARRRFGPSWDDALRSLQHAGHRREERLAMRDRLDALARDLRYGVRALRRAPAFTLTALATLALGLGAITVLFTVVRGVLLRPLPYERPAQLVQLWTATQHGDRVWFSDPDFADVARETRTLRALAQYQLAAVNVSGGAEAERVSAAYVSRDFPAVMGVRPLRGRWFVADEQAPGASRSVVVSEEFWRRVLGATAELGRRRLVVDGEPHAVVGVFPAGFAFPDDAELWLPRERREPNTSRTAHNWKAVARLRDGVAPEAAQPELTGIARAIRRAAGDDANIRDVRVVPLHREVVGDARGTLLLLFAGAAVLALVAAANVATLFLARAEARRRELGVRLALGASRGRLVRAFLVEAGLVAAGGAAGALALAWAATRVLAAAPPAALPRPDAVRVDALVLAFAAAAVLLVVGAVGGVTAWRATARSRATGDRSALGGRESARSRSALLGAQVAATTVLLVGAGLLARSYATLSRVDPGFRAAGPVVVSLRFPWAEDTASALRQRAKVAAVVARLRALPGVRAAGAVNHLPVLGGDMGSSGTFIVQETAEALRDFDDWGRLSKDSARTGEAAYRRAGDGYFAAMGIPVLRGRAFTRDDRDDDPPVAVISASLARRRFAGADPLGRLIQFGNMDGDLRPMRVVGVVGDVRESGLDGEPYPTVYALDRQRPPSASAVVVLAGAPSAPALDAGALAAAARAIVREVDPAVPVRVRAMEEVFARSLAARRWGLAISGGFAAAALALAAVGLGGVVSYLVAQRTREFGLRLALGARGADVQRMVVGRGLLPVAAGLACGLAVALAGGRLLAARLYDVRPTDPATYALVGVALLATAVLAAWGPARRAARIEPATTLRGE